MITPMTGDGAVDYGGAARLAEYLVTDMRNDGLVISGTTGESPTTSDAEKDRLLRAVIEAVGDRVPVVAGVGTNNTAHTCELARAAEQAGATGLLVVTPYYNKPPQAAWWRTSPRWPTRPGCRCWCTTSPAAAPRPSRPTRWSGWPSTRGSWRSRTPRSTSWTARRSWPAPAWPIYCGDDPVNLPWLSIGACGFVSVHSHVIGDRLADLIEAYFSGRVADALAIHRELLPVYRGMTRAQGAIMAKAALNMLGLPGGTARLPLVDATPAQIEQLRQDLIAGGVKIR